MRVKHTTTLLQMTSLTLVGFILAACNTSGTSEQATPTDALGLGQETASAQPAPVDNTNNLRAFCPRTVIRDGTEAYREFDEGIVSAEGAKQVSFQSTISEVARECNYTPTNLNIRVGVRGRAINGPSGKTGNFNVPIRVAVVDAEKNVQYSVLHQVPVTIPANGSNAAFSYVDSNINLPVPEKPNLIVYVGFDEGPPAETN